MFVSEPPRLVRLRRAIDIARHELACAEARWGSLSVEYVEARERRDLLAARLREAQQRRLVARLRQLWRHARSPHAAHARTSPRRWMSDSGSPEPAQPARAPEAA